MKLRTLVVGCGAVAQRLYRKPLQLLEKRGVLTVTALVDPAAEHAQAMQPFFPKAAHHTDLGAALEAGADLTLILTPAHIHCVQTLQALAKKSHVLCEKPMANT